MAALVKSIFLPTAPEPIVMVPAPELALIKQSSEEVGAEAPEAPPDEADQWVVLDASHVPVPPTQYLSAVELPYPSFGGALSFPH